MKKVTIFVAVIFVLLTANSCFAAYGDVTTWLSRIYAGDGGGPLGAYFDFPEDVMFDSQGNIFIADTYNNVIRKVNTNNITSTVAGTGSYGYRDGNASTAKFGQPRGLAVSGSTIIVADTWNQKIRKISNGRVSTIVKDGLNFPKGVAIYGSTVYISDSLNGSIKKVSINGGKVTTIQKGHGLIEPEKLKVDSSGRYLYVADYKAHKIFKVTISNGNIELIAGSGESGYKEGTGAKAVFQNSAGVVIDEEQNALFVTDGNGYTDRIRKIDLATKETSLVAWDSGMIGINYPKGIDIKGGYVYICNMGLGNIYRFNRYTGIIRDKGELMAGKARFQNDFGAQKKSLVGWPTFPIFSKDKKYIYLAENNLVRRIKFSTKRTKLIAGDIVDNYVEGIGTEARFSHIGMMALSKDGQTIYLADQWNNRIRSLNLNTLETNLISGGGDTNCSGRSCNGYKEGNKNSARFSNPIGLAISPDNKKLYVADTANERIRKVNIATGKTSLIAGSGVTGFADGIGNKAKFSRPYGLTINKAGTKLYVADSYNNRIREINLSTKRVTTLAGNNIRGYRDGYKGDASFSTPNFVIFGNDKFLYTSEAGTHNIRVIDPKNGLVKTITGTDTRGFQNGNRYHSEFNNPSGLLIRPKKGKLYVADTWNDLIRKVDISGSHQFYEKAPIVTGVLPTNHYPYSGNPSETKYLDITGYNFMSAATVYFGSYKANKTYFKNANALTAVIPFGKMPGGTYDVKVVNIDGQEYIKKGAFIIE